MREIEIKSFNGIGDLLFVTPTLRRIKEAYPASIVTVNTNHPILLRSNPFVDNINAGRDGVFLGYADPIHAKNPKKHHIMADWEIVKEAYELERMKEPALQPEIYHPMYTDKMDKHGVGVQVMHKGHWHQKKTWPYFYDFSAMKKIGREYINPIGKMRDLSELVRVIAGYKVVVCAEGGISHIAKAVGTPAVVIYGGFAKPEWNGYEDQTNLCNEMHCSYCYHPRECVEDPERRCLREISIQQVLEAVTEVLDA